MENNNINTNIDCMDFIKKQELDRKRIANELHDTSIQDLTHIIHQIELAGLYIDMDPVKAKLELAGINDEIRKIIRDIRNTIFDLRPMTFDDLGLKEALEQFIEILINKYDVDIETHIDFIDNYSEQKKMEIYRIIQECLNNSAKHAKASVVKLDIQLKENNLNILISDNGIGITNSTNSEIDKEMQTHYGLSIVKERVSILNGKCYINSKEGNGTHIQIIIPE